MLQCTPLCGLGDSSLPRCVGSALAVSHLPSHTYQNPPCLFCLLCTWPSYAGRWLIRCRLCLCSFLGCTFPEWTWHPLPINPTPPAPGNPTGLQSIRIPSSSHLEQGQCPTSSLARACMYNMVVKASARETPRDDDLLGAILLMSMPHTRLACLGHHNRTHPELVTACPLVTLTCPLSMPSQALCCCFFLECSALRTGTACSLPSCVPGFADDTVSTVWSGSTPQHTCLTFLHCILPPGIFLLLAC